LPRIWNNGILEYWNTGRLVSKRILSIFNFIFNTNFTINPKLHYPRTHYSIIPLFQHSNWGEAPNSCILKYDSIFCQIHFESYANEHAVYTMTLIKSHLKNTSNVQLRRCIPLQNTHILTCMLRFFIGLPPPNIGISQSSTCY